MNGRSGALERLLLTEPDDYVRLHLGLRELRELYLDLVRAFVPPNPQFERERIIASLPQPREVCFVFGLLSEGENEAALLLELVDAERRADPEAPVDHLEDEAWYYLRTSIDTAWQLDDDPPSALAALVYLHIVLAERLEELRASSRPSLAAEGDAERRPLLEALRASFRAASRAAQGGPSKAAR